MKYKELEEWLPETETTNFFGLDRKESKDWLAGYNYNPWTATEDIKLHAYRLLAAIISYVKGIVNHIKK